MILSLSEDFWAVDTAEGLEGLPPPLHYYVDYLVFFVYFFQFLYHFKIVGYRYCIEILVIWQAKKKIFFIVLDS